MNWRICALLIQWWFCFGISEFLYEGDDCKLENNVQGRCVRLSECPSAIEIVHKREHPVTCSYDNFTPIVCCPCDQILILDPNEQDECYTGTCKLLIDCPSALQMIKNQQHPVLCDYNRYMPMVCCEETTYYTTTTQLIPNYLTTLPPTKEQIFPIPQNEDKSLNPALVEEVCLHVKLKQREKLNYKDKEKQKSETPLSNEIVQFPHKVALGIAAIIGGRELYFENGIRWTCGGSLISNKFVLTAGHCLLVDGKRNLEYASVGSAILNTFSALSDPDQVAYKIMRQFEYPLYKFPSVYHDIGLVELQRPVEFSEYARPACLYQNMDQDTELISAGWGLGNMGTLSERMENANFNVYSEEDCAATYKDLYGTRRLPMGIVHQDQFCAGGLNDFGNIDSTKSDSGGVLQFSTNRGTVPYIVGIRSFGENLGLQGIPGVYTRVAPYVPWIRSIVWPQSDQQTSMMPPKVTQTRVKPFIRLNTSLSDRKCLFFREVENKTIDLVYKQNASLNLFVYGGADALPGEFPHMVALGYSKSEKEFDITWQCGGSLISEKFILTAAHCLASQDFGNLMWANVGRRFLFTYKDLLNPEQLIYKIIRQIPHPWYENPSIYHDIALLELERPVVLTSDVRPACLQVSDIGLKTAIATGWGLTEFGESITILQKSTLDIFTTDECDQTYVNLNNTSQLQSGIMHNNQFCAGRRRGSQYTCQGDSGGPLQSKLSNYSGNVWHIHGVASFSKSCGLQGRPGIYTRVSSYVPWIESVVWPNE